MLKKFDEVYARIKASLIMEEEDLFGDENINKLKDAISDALQKMNTEQKLPEGFTFDEVKKAITQCFEDAEDKTEVLAKFLDDEQVNKIKNGDVSDEEGLEKVILGCCAEYKE